LPIRWAAPVGINGDVSVDTYLNFKHIVVGMTFAALSGDKKVKSYKTKGAKV
jgi:hypothetical protein